MASKRRTLSDIKTAVRSKIRSKPRVTGSEYLEMFVLEKNKARLEQEKQNVDKRKTQIEKDISVINEELETLEDMVSETNGATRNRKKTEKLIPPQAMKVMKIDY